MKNYYLILLLFLFTKVNAQFYKKLSVDTHFGGRSGGIHSPGSTLNSDIHLDGGLLYKIDSLMFIRGGLSFDKFKTTKEVIIDRAYLIGISIQLLAKIIAPKPITKNFGLNFHTGIGLSTMNNPNYKVGKEFSDPGIRGNDDMLNVIIGITPHFRLNEKVSINVDFSTTAFLKQNTFVDMEIDPKSINKVGAIFNFTIGSTYQF